MKKTKDIFERADGNIRFHAVPETAYHWRLSNSPLYKKIDTIPINQNDIQPTTSTTHGSAILTQVKKNPVGRPRKNEKSD